MSPRISKSYQLFSCVSMFFLQIKSSPNSLRLTLPETNSSHLQPSFQCGRLRVETRLFWKGAFQHQNRGNSNKQWGDKKSSIISNPFFFPISIVVFLDFPQKVGVFSHKWKKHQVRYQTYILSFMFFFFGRNVVVPLGRSNCGQHEQQSFKLPLKPSTSNASKGTAMAVKNVFCLSCPHQLGLQEYMGVSKK